MELLRPSEAANRLGVSYPTLKQWIYRGSIESVRTAGGHHRIPASEVDRIAGLRTRHPAPDSRKDRTISGRNKLRGTILEVRYDGLFAQVIMDIEGQVVTSIITRSSAEEMALRPGMAAIALIKATQVMIVRPGAIG